MNWDYFVRNEKKSVRESISNGVRSFAREYHRHPSRLELFRLLSIVVEALKPSTRFKETYTDLDDFLQRNLTSEEQQTLKDERIAQEVVES